MRIERGLCPYVEGAEKATSPCVIDSTGDEAHDYLWRCPQGLLLEEPALQASLSQYAQIEALGGAAAYYGAQHGLGTLPARVTRTLQYLSAIKSRFERDVSRTQQEMLSQRTKPAMGRA